jgi:threonine/homoserine/homoserine lactone efflux protein
MTSLLPPGPLLGAFLIASVLLAVTPGPGVIYIVTRTLAQGRRSGLASVFGVAVGNFGNALAAAIGLGALFAVSSTAFLIVKYAGALYLIYLGIQSFRQQKPEADAPPQQVMEAGRIFRDGFLVALLNPKTAIFFAAFLPQFMSASGSPILQSVVLGTLFVVIAAFSDTVYALTASAVAPMLSRLQGSRSVGRFLTGAAFIALGLFTAFSGSHNANR